MPLLSGPGRLAVRAVKGAGLAFIGAQRRPLIRRSGRVGALFTQEGRSAKDGSARKERTRRLWLHCRLGKDCAWKAIGRNGIDSIGQIRDCVSSPLWTTKPLSLEQGAAEARSISPFFVGVLVSSVKGRPARQSGLRFTTSKPHLQILFPACTTLEFSNSLNN